MLDDDQIKQRDPSICSVQPIHNIVWRKGCIDDCQTKLMFFKGFYMVQAVTGYSFLDPALEFIVKSHNLKNYANSPGIRGLV